MRIIAGSARGRVFEAPKGMETRPTLDRVRENVFNILQMKVRGAQVLDLFSGSGAMAFEAISRGAERATLVDHDRQAHQIEVQNAQKLRMEDACTILHCDWKQAVQRLSVQNASFDLIILDPPYAFHDMTDILTALKPLMKKDAVVLLEHEAKVFPSVPDGFELYDSRKYGVAGVSFFRLWHSEEES